MTKIKNIFMLCVIVVLISSLVLAFSCKKEENQDVITETIIETVTETVEVGIEVDSSEISVLRFVIDESNPLTIELFKNIIADFEKMYPVKIQLELITGENQAPYYATNIAASNAPDIGGSHTSLTLEYIKAGYVEPLDDIINVLGGEEVFYSGSLFKAEDGHYYNYPFAGGGPVLYVRKDLFEEYNVKVPETWDEWLDAAEKLTLDTNNDGTIDIYGQCIAAGLNRQAEHALQTFTWQTGSTLFDADLNPTFNSEGMIKALEFEKQLSKYAPPGIGAYGSHDLLDSFASEKVAMTMYWGRLLAHLRDNAPDLLDKVQAVPLPTNSVHVTTSVYDNLCVFKDSKEPEIAKEFLKYLMSGDRITRLLLTVPGHLLPSRSNIDLTGFWEDEFVKSQEENIKTCFDVPTYGMDIDMEAGAKVIDGKMIPIDNVPYNHNISKIEAAKIISNMVQKVIIGNENPEIVASWGQAEVEKVIKDNE